MASTTALTPGRGLRPVAMIGLAAAYAVPAFAVWGAIGALLGLLSQTFIPQPVMAEAFVLAYCISWGTAEAMMLGVKLPNLAWQVPSRWIVGRSDIGQSLIWGALLGPGLVTSNSFATMWLIPMALFLSGDVAIGAAAGVVAGSVHGLARAGGIISGLLSGECVAHPLSMPLAKIGWRVTDGFALVFIAGILVAGISQSFAG